MAGSRTPPQAVTPAKTVKAEEVLGGYGGEFAVSENWPRPVIDTPEIVTTPPEGDPVPGTKLVADPLSASVTGPANEAIGPPLPSTAWTCTENGVPETALVGCCTNCNAQAPVTAVDGLGPDREKPPPTAELQFPGDAAAQGTLACSGTASVPPGAIAAVLLESVMVPVPCPEAVQPAGSVAVIVQLVGATSVTELNDDVLADRLLNVAVIGDAVPTGTEAGATARL